MNVLNFDSKLCERTRRQLDAYLSNELLVETTSEVVRHLESCESCAAELESRMRVRAALRRAALRQLPPPHLSEAIHHQLRRTQSGLLSGFRRNTWAWAVAAVLAVMLSGTAGQQLWRLRHAQQMVRSILALGVSDHVTCALRGHNYPDVARPPDELRQRLGPEYAGLVPVVEEKLSGFQVLEAHICSLPGSPRKYVHFIARGRGTILSFILTRRNGESLPAGRFLTAAAPAGMRIYRTKLEGMDVAGFETHEYFGFAVSDLGQEKMVQLAASLAPAVRNALRESFGTEKTTASVAFITSPRLTSGAAIGVQVLPP
jgi:anti-sigma factor RsiW